MILVDPASWKWRGKVWAHLVSDTSYQELHDFADLLGIPRRSFQGDHYDVPSDYREQAIALGAIAVSSRELVSRLRAAGLRRRLPGSQVAKAWAVAIERLGGDAVAAARTGIDLERRYRQPHRRYHTYEHIQVVLADADDLAALVDLPGLDRAILTLAVCAHDVVYEARPGKDEDASAAWVRLALEECDLLPGYRERVAAAVLATAKHSGARNDLAVELLLDADLAILAAPRDAYDRYVADVRMEYSSLDGSSWRRGRASVLENLAQRESLFFTSVARARWESRARANIERELQVLRQSDTAGPTP
jgi:predicted metal-dependent HD superfamily phosphohydrolase